MCRRSAQVIGLKKGWFLTSEAPAREPSRRISSLIRSLRITDLQRLVTFVSARAKGLKIAATHFETCGEFG